jgi:import inner membrane translocase subunit TIM17
MIYYRQQDDPFNAIVGGVITGGLLSIRGGASIAFKQACIGGVILMLIEGVQVIWMAHQTRM